MISDGGPATFQVLLAVLEARDYYGCFRHRRHPPRVSIPAAGGTGHTRLCSEPCSSGPHPSTLSWAPWPFPKVPTAAPSWITTPFPRYTRILWRSLIFPRYCLQFTLECSSC